MLLIKNALQANKIDLHRAAEEGSLSSMQMELVMCFTPQRVNERRANVSRVPYCILLALC